MAKLIWTPDDFLLFVSHWIYQVSVESSSGRDLKRNHLIVRIKLQNLQRRMAEDHSSYILITNDCFSNIMCLHKFMLLWSLNSVAPAGIYEAYT